MPFRKNRRVIFRRFQIDTTLCRSKSLVSHGVGRFGESFNRTVVISLSYFARWILVLSIIIVVIYSNNNKSANKVALRILFSLLTILIIVVTHRWRNSDSPEISVKPKSERAEMMQWVRESKLNGPFLFPVNNLYVNYFNEFQLTTHKPVWVDWKQGAAVMWEPSFYWQWMPRYKEVKSLQTKEDFTGYATRNRIPNLVLPRAIGGCTPDFDVVFQNNDFSVCVVK